MYYVRVVHMDSRDSHCLWVKFWGADQVNLPHLEARIQQGGNLKIDKLNPAGLQSLLMERFENVDPAAAADEVRPFLRDARELDLWSAEFFRDLVNRLA